MIALNLKIGKDYLTTSGLPVRISEIKDGNIILQSLASDNLFAVPANYPLIPFKNTKSVIKIRSNPYYKRFIKIGNDSQPKPLAPIIDALLLEGGRTMRGIVREVQRRASSACKGKDVRANIRARIYWFKRKGYLSKKNNSSHIKVIVSV